MAHVSNELLRDENERLQQALKLKKKHKKKGKVLDLQQREEYHGGAVLWSRRKLRESDFRERVSQQEEEQEQLQKAEMKELRAQAALLEKKEAEQERVARERAKVGREKE
ncbi:hypothetical protein EK21DRAFT_110516 [Setomelanomma holmii]|uniref:Uncharacterized protein n=1 Tax=Setomelanomma holmii TaxID=210430 RepID=A0A9P4LNA3_9PLEO|nr:hypothetical protein EK21DRAFT_110516 [Setomelanomma holmii]